MIRVTLVALERTVYAISLLTVFILMVTGPDRLGIAFTSSSTRSTRPWSLHSRPKGSHRRPRNDAEPRLHRRERKSIVFYLFPLIYFSLSLSLSVSLSVCLSSLLPSFLSSFLPSFLPSFLFLIFSLGVFLFICILHPISVAISHALKRRVLTLQRQAKVAKKLSLNSIHENCKREQKWKASRKLKIKATRQMQPSHLMVQWKIIVSFRITYSLLPVNLSFQPMKDLPSQLLGSSSTINSKLNTWTIQSLSTAN